MLIAVTMRITFRLSATRYREQVGKRLREKRTSTVRLELVELNAPPDTI